jgi:hypothetical protein
VRKLRDKAIEDAALDLRLFSGSEEWAARLPDTISLWNETAAWLEKLFGPRSFGLRLEQTNAVSFRFKPLYPGAWKRALGALWTICNKRPVSDHPKMRDLDWMFDLMMLAGMSQVKINWEATARQGAWHKRLRKTKAGKASIRAAALRKQLADDKQDQEDRRRRRLGIVMMRAPRRSGVFGSIPVIDSRRRHWPHKREAMVPVTSARSVFPP